MESLYLLIPVSLVIVLLIGGLLVWSVLGGQFDDLDAEGRRILDQDHAEAQPPASVKGGGEFGSSVPRGREGSRPD